MSVPRILIIAGSDSGGGAGIQADIKTVTMLGGHAMTAVTALTAQNTIGVQGVHPVPAEFVAEQMASVIEDIGVDAVKIGMLGSAEVIAMVAAILVAAPEIGASSALGWGRTPKPPGVRRMPIVLDPVMVAKGGDRLLNEDAVDALKNRLLPIATLVTPNSPELAVLTGRPVRNLAEAEDAASRLAEETGVTVLAKGGHIPGARITDKLIHPDGRMIEWEAMRIESRHTHGTGCTLASAVAVGLARGFSFGDSIDQARAYVQAIMHAAPGLGMGDGPMGHGLVRPVQA